MDTVTLVLAGDVPVDQFSTAVSGLARLLQGLTHELADQQRIRWSIDQLDSGSATIAVRGYAESDPKIVQRVVRAYGLVGKALATGEAIPFAQRTTEAAYEIVGAINGDLHSITFETPDIDYIVSARPAPQPSLAETRRLEVPVAYGSVQGRLQTLSSRGRLRFTLYDLVHDKAVSCYLGEGDEDLVRKRWGRLVTVEGYLSRDPLSGRPLAIRRISAIRDIVEGGHSDYQRGRGALRDTPSTVTVDQALRAVRDA